MYNNISATNFAIGGSSAFTGTVSLASPLISGSTGSFQGLSTTDLKTTGIVIHDILPICNVIPIEANELSNKGYVDTKNGLQDIRLTAIDNLNLAQNNRLTGIELKNTTQDGRLVAIDSLNIIQNDRLTAAEGINTTQDTRLDDIVALALIQDDRILAVEDKTTNLSFLNYRTTLTGAATVVNTLSFTVPPVSAALPTVASQLSNKQYVDNNVQIINNSILLTNNAAAALTTRVATVETKSTNLSYSTGSNTTSVSGAVAFLNAPTIGATSTATNSVQTKAYIDSRDQLLSTSITNLETRATAIEVVNTTQNTNITAIQAVNTTQSTSITALQQKTTPIAFSTPVGVGPLTEITSSLSLLPYTNASVLRAFSFFCNGMTCAIPATFGGTGLNQGVTTSQLTVGGFGTTFKTVYFGSVTSIVGTNSVTFATPLTGTFPKIFLQGLSGTVMLTNKTLAGFLFTATSVINVDYWVVQGL